MNSSPVQLQRARYATEEEHLKQLKRTTDPAMMRPRQVVGKYFLSKTLGKGSMGKVKLAMNTDTQEKVAVKIVPRKYSNSADQKSDKDVDKSREIRTIREASIMLLLDHPNIAKVFEMSFVDNFYYLFMEYVDGGQLLDYIISHGKLKERHARDIARQIASALDYCHRNSIVHRDLKVENILLSRTGQIKIIDFGLSNVFSPKSHLNTFCGSLYFAAPELLDGRVYTGPEVDIWSFGIILYVLVCGQVPFDDPTMGGMHVKVKRGYVEYPLHLSADCRSLLQRMIVTAPKNRATLTEVIFHPWMNRGFDTVVDNYLPKREPLKLPVDMSVIKGMKGFDLGTEDSIKRDLEALIASDEYQRSTKQQEANIPPIMSTVRRKSLSNVFGNQQQPQPQPVPPPAFHPLISVYYLVQEHMQKEARASTRRSSITPSLETSVVGITYTAKGKKEVHQPTIKQEQEMLQQVAAAQHSNDESSLHMSGLKPISTTTTTTSSTASSAASSCKSTKPSLFRRLSRRKADVNNSKRSEQSHDKNADEGNAMSVPPPPPVIINTYHHGHQEQRHHISPVQQQQQSHQIRFSTAPGSAQPVVAINGSLLPDQTATLSPTISEASKNSQSNTSKWNKLLKRATSVNLKNKGHHFDPESRRKSTCGAAMLENRQHRGGLTEAAAAITPTATAFNAEEMYLALPSSTHNPPTASSSADTIVIQQKENGDHLLLDQAEDTAVKTVYVKGLFSVSTTSNKKPSEIRKEIIRVLRGNAYIEFRETKDRFECVLLTKSKRGRREDIGYFTDEDDMLSGQADRQEQRKQGIVYANKDPQAVRFDVYIVKIPWLLGMHGLQFRRVSGDSWHYKNICSKILDNLKL